MKTLAEAAVEYAELGWRVHPLVPDGKAPLLAHGVHDASNDPARVRRWWKQWPNANIGVATGPDSFDALDVDTKNGSRGMEYAERARDAGLLSGWIAVVETPSGGLHIWFPPSGHGGGVVGGKKRDLELKARGGYVLVEPSYVIGRDDKTGEVLYEGVYRMTKVRDQGEPLDWPAVKALFAPPAPVLNMREWTPKDGQTVNFDGLIRRVADQGPRSNNRNNCLYWACCRAVEGGAPPAVFRDLAAAAIANGLPEQDAWRTVSSAQRIVRGAA